MARRSPAPVEPVDLTAKEIAVINKIINPALDGADGTLGSTAWVKAVIGNKSREQVLGSLEEKGVIVVEDSEDKGNPDDLYVAFPASAHPIIQKAVDAGQLPESIFESSDEDDEDENAEDADDDEDEDEDDEPEPAPAPTKKGKTVATAPAETTAKAKVTRGTAAATPAPAAATTKKKTAAAASAAPANETFPQKMARLKAEKAARIAAGEEAAPTRAAKKTKTAKAARVAGTPTSRLGYTESDPRYLAVHQLAGIARKVRRAQINHRRGVAGWDEAKVEAAHTALVDFINSNDEVLELTE